jgi:hypothetical protein
MAYSESGREVASWVGDNGLGNEIERASLALTERRAINTANGGLVGVFADVKYPFVDYDLLDYYTKLPVDWRRGGRLYKAIICKAFPELVDVPCISDNTMFVPCRLDTEPGWLQLKRRNFGRAFRFYAGRLTGGLLSLKDHRTYLHYDHWYRTNGTLRGWIQSLLGDKRTLDRGYFDPEGIRLLFQLEFTRGYLFSTLAVLASFEYWNRFFVDRQQLSSQALTQDATDIKVVR